MNHANRVNHNILIQFLEKKKDIIFEFHRTATGEDWFSIKWQHVGWEKEVGIHSPSLRVSILKDVFSFSFFFFKKKK